MTDYKVQADLAATTLLVETGIRPPVEDYETLHMIVSAAYLTGLMDGFHESREVVEGTRNTLRERFALDIHNNTPHEIRVDLRKPLTDPRDST